MHAAGGLPQRFADEMGRLLGPDFPKQIAIAVSGGGDSMAMLHLAAPWARVMGIGLWVVTVDHGLRPESVKEAEMVAREAATLGLPQATLRWSWDGKGNVQDAARQARLSLIDRWREGIEHVLFAHTQDDQAETFLMRLARGSGVEGLSAMAAKHEIAPDPSGQLALSDAEVVQKTAPPMPARRVAGVPARRAYSVIRPLLGTTRAELRHYLGVLKVDYVDDPSNDDLRFDRVKMRQALPALAEIGLTAEKLAQTAGRMGQAREALGARALAALSTCEHVDASGRIFDVTFERDAFAKVERDTQLRLLAAALQFVSLAPYRPRLSALDDALDRALGGGATTLHGGYVYPNKGRLYVVPEYGTVAAVRPENGCWRGLYIPSDKDVRPLGERGAAQLRDITDLPARVLWPAPAVWQGDTVLASPRLGRNAHWNPVGQPERFLRLITSR